MAKVCFSFIYGRTVFLDTFQHNSLEEVILFRWKFLIFHICAWQTKRLLCKRCPLNTCFSPTSYTFPVRITYYRYFFPVNYSTHFERCLWIKVFAGLIAAQRHGCPKLFDIFIRAAQSEISPWICWNFITRFMHLSRPYMSQVFFKQKIL